MDRSRPKVGRGFLRFFCSISLAPTNIVVSGHTKNYGKTRKTKGIYGKTRKPLRRKDPKGKAVMQFDVKHTVTAERSGVSSQV